MSARDTVRRLAFEMLRNALEQAAFFREVAPMTEHISETTAAEVLESWKSMGVVSADNELRDQGMARASMLLNSRGGAG